MRQFADGGGIEQPAGRFLQRRTHTPDPQRSFAIPESGHSKAAIGQLPQTPASLRSDAVAGQINPLGF
jgi:hypothetical protein